VLAQRAPTDLHKIHTDFVDLNALLQRFESRVGKELAEMRQELCDELDMRLQGVGKSARIAQGHRFDFMLEVLQRVQWIRPLLLRQPQPGESRDPHLRFMEVKFMIQRLDRLLWALEAALSGVR